MIMKTLPFALACFAASFACAQPAHSPPTPAPQTSAATGGSGGGHVTRHGGVIVMTASPGVHLHTEVVVTSAGAVQLFLTDANGTPIPTAEASGTLTCGTADPVTLTGAQEALSAKCPLLRAATVVRYQLTIRGTPASGELEVPAAGTAAIEPNGHAPGHSAGH